MDFLGLRYSLGDIPGVPSGDDASSISHLFNSSAELSRKDDEVLIGPGLSWKVRENED